jgi:hypothetical protein
MATSFKTDIVPLFTSVDKEHMSRLEVPLDDYAYMSRPITRPLSTTKYPTGPCPQAPAVSNPGQKTRSSCSSSGWTGATRPSRAW